MDDYEFGYSPEFSGFESFNYDGSDFSGFDGLNIDSLLSSNGIDAGGLDLGSMGGNLDDLLSSVNFENLLTPDGVDESGSDLRFLLNDDSGLSKYDLTSDRSTSGGLYKVGPNQVAASEDGTGLRMSTNPVEFKKDGSVDWNSLFSSENNGEPGIRMKDTLPGQDSMNGAQGLTYYRPPEYDSSGMTIPGTGGTVTASGFVPDGSQHALGNPNSWINNPNITGQKGVTSANNIVTPNLGGLTAAPTVTTTPGATKVTPGTNTTSVIEKIINTVTGGGKTNPDGTKKGMDPMAMMMLMLMLSQMGKGGGGGSSSSGATIPSLSANRSQLPYSPPSRPGAGGTTYFSPTTYAPRMAGGGEIVMGGGGISSLGSYSDGGRLLKGPGDGVSDGIPATIAGKQPARLAEGEFVIPARVVSELGNGSTDAGADRLYAMMDRVQKARRKTKNVAADTKAHKYLPA
jgi:hypothetical protein